MRPRVLGVTGCVGAGKSTAGATLAARGWAVLDLDAVVRGLLAARGVDRAALFAEVLADAGAMARWRDALLPTVLAHVDAWIAALDGPAAIESALLFEVGLEARCDLTLCLRCPVPVRRRRVQARARPSAAHFAAIEAAQWSESAKAARADAELWSNDGEPARLDEAIAAANRAALRRRWHAMLAVLEVSSRGNEVFDGLCARYAEPHRAYHTLEHISACLRALDGAPVPDLAVVGLAVFYHDAIYEPLARDNEERSADLALGDLSSLGIPDVGTRVADLVRLTEKHDPAGDDAAAWLIDADLSVLAAGARDFAAYDANVRGEYAVVPDEVYAPARAQALRSFLERPVLFQTEWFRSRCEARARANLARFGV